MTNQQSRRLRMNLWFGGAVLLLLTAGVISGLFSGEAFNVAVWNSIKQGRPLEWMMFFLFWYAAVFSPNLDFWWNRRVTSIGLLEHK